ncbi:MAG: lipocalin family protein [Candidatus Zixiibacteriota bacterium]|nr:MAG: lipocalin family protein [candidate division Zixibacteria bacterium]
MKIFKVVSILLVLAFLLAGCGKDGTTTPNVRVFPSELVGTWNYQSVTIDGQEAVLRLILDWQEETVMAALIISDDGEFVINEYSANDSLLYFEDGTFAVNGNYFTITIYNNSNGVVSPPVSRDGTWEVSGNHLILYLNINEIIAAIITTRQS